MIAAILAGGMGARLQKFTTLIRKPMVEIGDRPILWHIMKIYDAYGIRDFCVALGYTEHIITEKPIGGETRVSGGFFVFEPDVFDYLDAKGDCILEHEPLERLAAAGELAA